MLNFKAVGLDDRHALEPVFHAQPYRICDHNFACLYIWDHIYPAEFCFDEDVLYIKYTYPDKSSAYQLPYCTADRLPEAVEKLRVYAESKNDCLVFVTLNDQQKTLLSQAVPNAFDYEAQPDYADYIYNAEDLITLRGRKFHSKRNFISRFEQQYAGRYSFEKVGPENLDQILALTARWDKGNEGNGVTDEAKAISRALHDLEKIGMFGVAMRLDGEIEAFALGTKLSNDTILEQIEKSSDITGGYQMINRAFAECFASEFVYINREEDMGIEGLRKSKLSYNPAYINMRYRAVMMV